MHAQIAGCQIEFDDLGQGQPLVLLHASPLSRRMWRPQIEAWRSNYRLIAPDLRGFGGSALTGDKASLDLMADDVEALLSHLKLQERVVLIGSALGAGVALVMVRKYPERLRALILADFSPGTPLEARAQLDRMIAFIESHSVEDMAPQALTRLVSPETQQKQPELVAEIRRIITSQSTAGIAAALRAVRDRRDEVPQLGRITIPTLVIVGKEDPLTPPAGASRIAAAGRIAAAIPGAKMVEIPGAARLPNLEQPAAFNQAVLSFLQGL